MNVSVPSTSVSPSTWTVITAEVWPTANVTVPDAAWKSLPLNAVPGPVTHWTVVVSVAALSSEIVRLTLELPELPSVTVASLIEIRGPVGWYSSKLGSLVRTRTSSKVAAGRRQHTEAPVDEGAVVAGADQRLTVDRRR